MIPLQFGLFWSGAKLSYLRYLTFSTLRKWHPDSKIDLYTSKKELSEKHKNIAWANESQDFKTDLSNQKDYLEKLKDLNVNIVEIDLFDAYAPNFQSDLFRWWWLNEFGGFYLDTDQIILQSFSTLPLDNDFIYSSYPAKSCGFYFPVGVLGSTPNNKITNDILNTITMYYKEGVYNSMGPDMFRSYMIRNSQLLSGFKKMNAPFHYFYPIAESYLAPYIYDGKFKPTGKEYALHWYGGSTLSQKFNKAYTEDFAKDSNDSISKIMRGQ